MDSTHSFLVEMDESKLVIGPTGTPAMQNLANKRKTSNLFGIGIRGISKIMFMSAVDHALRIPIERSLIGSISQGRDHTVVYLRERVQIWSSDQVFRTSKLFRLSYRSDAYHPCQGPVILVTVRTAWELSYLDKQTTAIGDKMMEFPPAVAVAAASILLLFLCLCLCQACVHSEWFSVANRWKACSLRHNLAGKGTTAGGRIVEEAVGLRVFLHSYWL